MPVPNPKVGEIVVAEFEKGLVFDHIKWVGRKNGGDMSIFIRSTEQDTTKMGYGKLLDLRRPSPEERGTYY
jgi:hypothetical protein